MLNAFDDLLLSISFLNLVLKSYQPDGEHCFLGSENEYLSPGLSAADEDLAKFPPTHLLLAGVDPLKDEGIQFCHRLLTNKVPARITEMDMMPHGFLSFYFPLNQGMNEARSCIKKSVEIL